MAIDPIINASASKIINTAVTSGNTMSGVTFSDFMSQKIGESIQTLKNFEVAADATTHGQISELDLVKAVNEADLHLQAFKVIWEKFLQKYETIIEKTNI